MNAELDYAVEEASDDDFFTKGKVTVVRKSLNPQVPQGKLAPYSFCMAYYLRPGEKTKRDHYLMDMDDGTIGPQTMVTIEAGGELIFDLENPIHRHNFRIIYEAYQLNHWQVDLEFHHQYEKQKKDRANRLSRRAGEDALNKLVEDQQFEDLEAIALRIGFVSESETTTQDVIDYLYSINEKDPGKILGEINNPDKDVFFAVERGVKTGIILTINGLLYYGDLRLGYNHTAAVVTLKNNASALNGLKIALEKRAENTIPTRTPKGGLGRKDALDEVALAAQRQREADAEEDERYGLSPKDVFEAALKKGIITEAKTAGSKSKGYEWNGKLIGADSDKALAFLIDNDVVRGIIEKELE